MQKWGRRGEQLDFKSDSAYKSQTFMGTRRQTHDTWFIYNVFWRCSRAETQQCLRPSARGFFVLKKRKKSVKSGFRSCKVDVIILPFRAHIEFWATFEWSFYFFSHISQTKSSDTRGVIVLEAAWFYSEHRFARCSQNVQESAAVALHCFFLFLLFPAGMVFNGNVVRFAIDVESFTSVALGEKK